ncbi:outer membrane lipoprotein chaperone LolA [Pseudoalteromonas xiamenensis]
MKKLVLALSIVSLFGAVQVQAKPEDVASLKAKLSEMKTYSAQFVQTVEDEQGTRVMEGKGKLLLESPLKMRWEQQEPDETLFVSNGKQGFYFDSFAEQVTVMDSAKLVEQTPFVLLTSTQSESWLRYDVTKETSTYVITPITQGDSQVERLVVAFDDTGILKSVVLTDVSGQRSTYAFSAIKTNLTIPQSNFNFTIPEGVFVDDQTRSE